MEAAASLGVIAAAEVRNRLLALVVHVHITGCKGKTVRELAGVRLVLWGTTGKVLTRKVLNLKRVVLTARHRRRA